MEKSTPYKYETVKYIEKLAGITPRSRVIVQNLTEIGSFILGGQIGDVTTSTTM